MMNVVETLRAERKSLHSQIAKIDHAINILGNGSGHKRTLSPEARQRIAEAQRARWAKAKKAAKSK